LRKGGVHTWFLVGKLERKRQLGSPGVDEKILLKLIFKKWDCGHGLD